MKIRTHVGVEVLFLCFSSSAALIATNALFSQSAATLASQFNTNFAVATSSTQKRTLSSSTTSTNNTLSSHTVDGRIILRLATRADVPCIQECNLATSSENYPPNHYENHLRRWPDLALVAEHFPSSYIGTTSEGRKIRSNGVLDLCTPEEEQQGGKIVGYILGKVVKGYLYSSRAPLSSSISPSDKFEEDVKVAPVSLTKHRGHITSIAILPAHRRRGLAVLLMKQLHHHMNTGYVINYVGLNVRASNIGAKRLYCEKLGYEVSDTIKRYYDDDSDALFMRKTLSEAGDDRDRSVDLVTPIDGNSEEILEGWRWLDYALRSYWDKKIGDVLRSYQGKKKGSDKISAWDNGHMEFRLPRDIPQTLEARAPLSLAVEKD